MNKRSLRNWFLPALLLLLISCLENELPNPDLSQVYASEIASAESTVSTYPLEWENRDFMPTPPGVSPIPVPWANAAARQFSPEMAKDHKKANGWTLVSNSFNTVYDPHKYCFVLYNKYSGLLRMYLYIPRNLSIPSGNIIQTLELEGPYKNSSPMLNFSDQLLVDTDARSSFASSVEKAQAESGVWYAFEHELAYDQNIDFQDSNTVSFLWRISSAQITEVILNGNVKGSLDGNITLPGVNLSLSENIIFTNNTFRKGIIKLTGKDDTDNLPEVGHAFLSGAQEAVKKAGLGIVEGILSGSSGKNSNGSSDNMSLKLSATIGLNISLLQNTLIDSRSFAVPGADNSNLIGGSPAYEKPLGVFYISGRPVIRRTETIVQNEDHAGQEVPSQRRYTYEVLPESYALIFNPEVLLIADIRNIRSEVVVNDLSFAMITGRKENIGGQFYRTGPLVTISDYQTGVVGTRVTFDVIPKDGSPKITITKTFKSNISYKTVRTGPNSNGQGNVPYDNF